MTIRGVGDTVDIARVTSELFQRFPTFQSMYPHCHVKTGRQELKVESWTRKINDDADTIYLRVILGKLQTSHSFAVSLLKFPQTLSRCNFPNVDVAALAVSGEHLTVPVEGASSIIMKFSAAWYLRSFLILPVVRFHTSIKPSTLPEMRYWPSGLKRADSM